MPLHPLKSRLTTQSILRYNGMAKASYENAANKGFWEGRDVTCPAIICKVANLQRSELGEFTDDHRKPDHIKTYFVGKTGSPQKPCGAIIELADVLIRLADWHVGFLHLLLGIAVDDITLNDVHVYVKGSEQCRAFHLQGLFFPSTLIADVEQAAFDHKKPNNLTAEDIILDRLYGHIMVVKQVSVRAALLPTDKRDSSIIADFNMLVARTLDDILLLCAKLDFSEELFWINVEEKMTYNLGRPYKHGAAY